ncbi:MAG: 2-amino-4-hydroxy-6-hydroxymethyldihydropteridine pyrophosphokinae [Firmicutes bacterium]|nr:2-amino-4-hydroxy-6-hydroxymethyldihydropteridine pyrophosphokinae [Bacillota bacterium]
MSVAYLSLGSNLGDRLGTLAKAVRSLEQAGTRLLRVSSVYETAPQGKTDQPSFLNVAVQVETTLEPLALLARIQAVEQGLGRVRTVRWGPRTVDIDMLLYGGQVFAEPALELPHPRMLERAFVLIPLLEVDPLVSLPATGEPLQLYLDRLPDQAVVPVLEAEAFLRRIRAVQ